MRRLAVMDNKTPISDNVGGALNFIVCNWIVCNILILMLRVPYWESKRLSFMVNAEICFVGHVSIGAFPRAFDATLT